MALSKETAIPTPKLAVRLIKCELFFKYDKKEDNSKVAEVALSSQGSDEGFSEANEEDMKLFNDPKVLADPALQLKQIYDVEISPLEQARFPKLTMNISANKSLTSVYAIIKAGSVIQKTQNISKDLTDYFNERKLRARVLINLWDEEMKRALSKIAAKIEVNAEVTFSEDQQILVCQSLGAVPTRHDKLIMHFEDKHKKEDDYGRIDYKARGFITAVEEGETLITYLKPKTGKPGRNCRGAFIEVPEASNAHQPTFEIDPDTIEVKEDEDKIEYISKRNGYIDFENNRYYIKEALEVSEISFKSTGNVNAGLNTDIAIKVSESDAMKDAIGMGVEVEASEVDVEGNTGSNSVVRAKMIRIGGQTHQSSELYAPNIVVNLHRGRAFGDEIEIKRLEQGYVKGKKVTIQQAAGGEVHAEDVTIELLQSHATIYASHSIVINKMKGSENTLIIDQTEVGENKEAKEHLEAEIDQMHIELNLAKKVYEEDKALMNKHKSTILEIKQRLLAYQKAGAKMPDSFVKKYKEFQSMQAQMNQHKRDMELKQEMLELLMQKRTKFQTDVLEAKVINYDIWRGHNEVVFHLTSPDIELRHVPREGMTESVIQLKYDKEDDHYEIVAKSMDLGAQT